MGFLHIASFSHFAIGKGFCNDDPPNYALGMVLNIMPSPVTRDENLDRHLTDVDT